MTSTGRGQARPGPASGTGLASSAVPPAPVTWPTGVSAAACLTFDMDAEAPILTADISSIDRMTPMSHQSYGPLVGVPRILELLGRHDIKATFFVPGYSAHRYPGIVRRIAEAGHEIAHHSYFHENTIAWMKRLRRPCSTSACGRCAIPRASGPPATAPPCGR